MSEIVRVLISAFWWMLLAVVACAGGILGVAIYRVATGTDRASRGGQNDRVSTGERVVAVKTNIRGKKEVIRQ